jgi:hypothetical protein
MSGYHTILKCEKIKERADKLGFMLCYPRHGWGAERGVDYVAIKPKDNDALPIYCRDAELFCGTIDDLESFFQGIEWARQYDKMLRVSTKEKRERKEQDERNRQLVSLLKDEKVPMVQT